MTITERLRVPPCAYALLAFVRVGQRVRPMTAAELAQRSGLPARTVARLRRKTVWGDVPIAIADRFIMGCGFDPLGQKEALRRLRRWLTGSGLARAQHLRLTAKLSLSERSLRVQQVRRVRVMLEG